MKLRFSKARAGVLALVVSGGLLAAGGGAASAATTPPWEPDPTSIGSLTFYDAAGNVVTGGSINDAPFAAYVQASAAGRAGDTKATLFGYLPKNGVAIGAWTGEALTASPTYPNAGAPAALASSPLPLVSLTGGDETIATLAGDLPNTATDAYQGLYQLRLKTSGVGQPAGSSYDSADILITGTTWTLVYPAPVAATTTVSLATVPVSPQNVATSIALNATVTPSSAAGTVQFKDGAATIGSPVTVSGGTASTSTSSLAVGTHSLTAVFTPANPATFGPSTSSAVSFVVNGIPAAGTTTALSVNPTTAPAFTAVTLHADVSKTSDSSVLAVGTGAVKFFDGTATLGQVSLTATGADLTVSTLATGGHSITAQFIPADAAVYASSTSPAVPFTATAPTNAPGHGSVVTHLDAGTITITTPYTDTNPFDLGALVLDPTTHTFKASAAFGSAADPSKGVSVIDGRAGDLPWTASVTTTDFVDGTADVINGENLTFTSITPQYIAGDALNAATKPVTTTDVTTGAVYAPADAGHDGLKGGPHQFAAAVHGLGSVYLDGLLGLIVPASTPAGAYTATLTFTIA